MSLKDIDYPIDSEYSSDGSPIPLEFYLDIFPQCSIVYLKLGYFSSKAIQVLAYGFARFIARGGKIRIITNHFLYNHDKELLDASSESNPEKFKESFLRDVSWISGQLEPESQHVLDCLKFLVEANRLEILPVMLKPQRMVHFKQGIFIDSQNNAVFMDGSCNFTANGLIENAETISVLRSWGSEFERNRIESKKKNQYKKLRLPRSKVDIHLSKELADRTTPIAREVGKVYEGYGIRAKINFRCLLKCLAYRNGRKEVTEAELDEFVELAEYMNLEFNQI